MMSRDIRKQPTFICVMFWCVRTSDGSTPLVSVSNVLAEGFSWLPNAVSLVDLPVGFSAKTRKTGAGMSPTPCTWVHRLCGVATMLPKSKHISINSQGYQSTGTTFLWQ